MADEDMTVRQAADALGVSTAAIHQQIKRGALPARRVGFVWLLSRADVLAYQAAHAHKQRPGPRPKEPAAAPQTVTAA